MTVVLTLKGWKHCLGCRPSGIYPTDLHQRTSWLLSFLPTSCLDCRVRQLVYSSLNSVNWWPAMENIFHTGILLSPNNHSGISFSLNRWWNWGSGRKYSKPKILWLGRKCWSHEENPSLQAPKITLFLSHWCLCSGTDYKVEICVQKKFGGSLHLNTCGREKEVKLGKLIPKSGVRSWSWAGLVKMSDLKARGLELHISFSPQTCLRFWLPQEEGVSLGDMALFCWGQWLRRTQLSKRHQLLTFSAAGEWMCWSHKEIWSGSYSICHIKRMHAPSSEIHSMFASHTSTDKAESSALSRYCFLFQFHHSPCDLELVT